MAIDKYSTNHNGNKLIISRLAWIERLSVIIFLFFGGRLWHLQIIQGDYYEKLSEQNHARSISLLAPRGIIKDREGRPLVVNRPAFNAYLLRENIRSLSDTLVFIEKGLGLTPDEVRSRLEKFQTTPSFQPIVIKGDLSIQEIAFIESHQLEHPEIRITAEPRRFYPYGALAAHVFGYVGEISNEQLKRGEFPNAKPGEIVGKAGIEKQYNALLVGKDGKKRVLVNSAGREVDVVSRQEPQIGKELRLTLDFDLQHMAETMLQDKTGAIVGLNPNNGEVLVMASSPGFDPNNFAVRISYDKWEELISHPDYPLQNRVVQTGFSPGSVFKVIMAYAGLAEGLISPESSVYCTGETTIYGHVFHCHKRHGLVDLRRAIVNSCNIFFYHLGKSLGIERIAKYAKRLGLGEKTNIDLPEEKFGFFPTPEWKWQNRGEKWFAGETISVAIGQGAVTVTPIQIARAISAIATGHAPPRPHLLLDPKIDPKPGERKVNESGLFETLHAQPLEDANQAASLLSDKARRVVVDGMWGVVNDWGTGKAARVEGWDVCGKTGTTQLISNEGKGKLKEDKDRFEPSAWFVAFAPKDQPEIVLAIIIERGGYGGVSAAPIAGEILRTYFNKKVAGDE